MKIKFNGETREVSEDITIANLLKQVELDPRRVAVEVNLELAPRERHGSIQLKEGDQLEVVTLVGGG